MHFNPNMPRAGELVLYYPSGVVAEGTGTIAWIINAFNEDLVTLVSWDATRMSEHQAVLRSDCKAVKDNPAVAQMRGLWQFREPPEMRNAIYELVYGRGNPEPLLGGGSRSGKSMDDFTKE